MEITIPLIPEICLKIASDSTSGKNYPTAKLQKGLLLICGDRELAEEGVGFGVPVLKRGLQTIFPGDLEWVTLPDDKNSKITVRFKMNRVEKIARPGFESVKNQPVYTVKNFLAALIRHYPLLRGLLTAASNALRSIFGWETTFEDAGFCLSVSITFQIDRPSGLIQVEVDAPDLSKDGITEIVIMNEQGARPFDIYRDSDGTLQHGKEIGCWDEVTSEWAAFISKKYHLGFTLRQVPGTKLYRGREMVGSRLAWSGFGYSFAPVAERMCYAVKIERLP